jgi:hypothetical protein
MLAISMFHGLVVCMFFMDTQQHYLPHVHVEYQGKETVVSIPDGEILEGGLPSKQLQMLQAWIVIHEDELMADWALAVKGEPIFKIEPLR